MTNDCVSFCNRLLYVINNVALYLATNEFFERAIDIEFEKYLLRPY